MKNYIKGGFCGGIFGGLMAGFFVLSQYLGAYTTQGDSFTLRVTKDVSEIFLFPAAPFLGFVSISVFLISVTVIYFLLGALALGTYFKWRETNQPNNWILKHFPVVLLLLIVILAGFRIQSSWSDWGRWQIYLSCEKDYGPAGGGNYGGKGEQTRQEADQKDAMRIQCLKDRGYLDKSFPGGPTNTSQLDH